MLARLIPSMFLRRVLLIGGLLAVSALLPILQLVHLTVARGDEFLRDAQRKLVVERWLPTQRGRILDRKGRVLALNRPSYDIAVDYPVITGEWARDQATRHARSLHRSQWRELNSAQREELVERYLPQYQERLDACWTRFAFMAGVPIEEIDQRRQAIQRQVEAMAATIWRAREQQARQEILRRLERRGELVEDEDHPELAAAARIPRRPIQEQTAAHVILRGVDDQTAFAFKNLEPPPRGVPSPSDLDPLAPEPMPGLRVIDAQARDYPFQSIDLSIDRSTFPANLRADGSMPVRVEGVATHILGWMRSRIFREDIESRPRELVEELPDGTRRVVGIDRGHYQVGDVIGAAGLEAALERDLRGLRGLLTQQLDTLEEERIEPEAGADVPLTIDIMLQARIQALFDPSLGLAVTQPWHKSVQRPDEGLPVGTVLTGAAVVIDVDSGEILALVTAPSFTFQQLRDDASAVYGDPLHMPHINRATDKPYQPGSIVKPLMLVGATSGGHLQHGGRISCTGHFHPDRPDMLRCWIYKQSNHTQTHDGKFGHPLDGAEALMVSCNIFFFELGRRLAPRGVVEWFTKFGVGRDAVQPRTGLPGMFPGTVGPMGRGGGVPPSPSEAIQMAIGQGPIAWTPLHAADAYATLARMGLRVVPRLRRDEPAQEFDLGLDPSSVSLALRGLRASVEEADGTGHHLTLLSADRTSSRREDIFNAKGVTVWGKTGTADAAALVADNDETGKREVLREGDHSWTVILCGPSSDARPRYAVAVVVDFGGSGGRVSGPIANQVVHALIAEGYLPGGGSGRGRGGGGAR